MTDANNDADDREAYADRIRSADPAEGPARGWDIHCHTTFSDGTRTPAQLVEEARARGLHGVAITDHDTWNGWEEAAAAARRVGIPLLRGTEVTAHCGRTSVHMLGYLYDPDDRELAAMFARTRRARVERAREMVRRINAEFPQITWDAVCAQAGEGKETTVGRPHIADALVAAGICTGRDEAFATVLSARGPFYIPTPSPDAAEVVRVVKGAGGATVVAHAGDPSRNSTLLTDAELEKLIAAGLDGIEVHHRGNPVSQRRDLMREAIWGGVIRERLGLPGPVLVTGGSDWHGAGKPNVLGENLTGDDTVALLAARCALPIVEP